jgi:hypothetical protein
MSYMFKGAVSFNQPLIWKVKNVQFMAGMFRNATSFNQPLYWSIEQINQLGLANPVHLDQLCEMWSVEKIKAEKDLRVHMYKVICNFMRSKKVVPFEHCVVS